MLDCFLCFQFFAPPLPLPPNLHSFLFLVFVNWWSSPSPRTILGMPVKNLEMYSFQELSAMIYRDTIQQKHQDRARLEREMIENKETEEIAKKEHLRLKSLEGSTASGVNTVTEIILEHLLAVL